MGGILIQTLAFAMMGPAQTVATDFQQGAIDRFRSLPIARSAYLLGHYFAEMFGAILTIVILLGTGLLVGWRTHSGDPRDQRGRCCCCSCSRRRSCGSASGSASSCAHPTR